MKYIIATHTIAADYGSVINTLNCNTTVAVYNFTILWPDTFELQTKLICKYSDTGKVCACVYVHVTVYILLL